MKKFFLTIGVFMVFAVVNANAPKEPKCLKAGPGETNNGHCYFTYGQDGKINGVNCTSSPVEINCIF